MGRDGDEPPVRAGSEWGEPPVRAVRDGGEHLPAGDTDVFWSGGAPHRALERAGVPGTEAAVKPARESKP